MINDHGVSARHLLMAQAMIVRAEATNVGVPKLQLAQNMREQLSEGVSSPLENMSLGSPGRVTCNHMHPSPAFSSTSATTSSSIPMLQIGSSCSTCRSNGAGDMESNASVSSRLPVTPPESHLQQVSMLSASQLLRAYSPASSQTNNLMLGVGASLIEAAGLEEVEDEGGSEGSVGSNDELPTSRQGSRSTGSRSSITMPPFMTGGAAASDDTSGARAPGSGAGSEAGSRKSSGAGDVVAPLTSLLPGRETSFQERLTELLKARGFAQSFDSEFNATRDSWSLSWREAAEREESMRFPRLGSTDDPTQVTMQTLLGSARSVHSTPRAGAIPGGAEPGSGSIGGAMAPLTLSVAHAGGSGSGSGSGGSASARVAPRFMLSVGGSSGSSWGGSEDGGATTGGAGGGGGGSSSGSDSLTPTCWPAGGSISPAPPRYGMVRTSSGGGDRRSESAPGAGRNRTPTLAPLNFGFRAQSPPETSLAGESTTETVTTGHAGQFS